MPNPGRWGLRNESVVVRCCQVLQWRLASPSLLSGLSHADCQVNAVPAGRPSSKLPCLGGFVSRPCRWHALRLMRMLASRMELVSCLRAKSGLLAARCSTCKHAHSVVLIHSREQEIIREPLYTSVYTGLSSSYSATTCLLLNDDCR